MPVRLNGATSGYTELSAPAVAGITSITFPNGVGNNGQVLSTDGNGLLSFVNRIEWDQFQLITDVTSDGDMTSWARSSYTGFVQVGDTISHSSGIFSFPTTGYYLVMARPTFDIAGDDTIIMRTEVTTDNSTYNLSGYASDGNNGTGTRHGSSTSYTFIDVTDTANVKVKFVAASISGSSKIEGGSSSISVFTQVMFIRLGDT
jgi:hypothetical protein